MAASRQTHRRAARGLCNYHEVTVVDVQATTDGPLTEIVVYGDRVPPRILDELADHGLGLDGVRPQGPDYVIAEAR